MRIRYFPWRFFFKVFTAFGAATCLLFVLAIALWQFFVDSESATTRLTLTVAFGFPAALIISALFAFRTTWPLRRIILKALRIASKKNAPEILETDEELFEQEAGEYLELEQALSRIQRKMQKRRNQLAHEREEAQALMSFLADAVVSLDRDERIKFYNSNFATQFLPVSQAQMASEGKDVRLSEVFRDPEILETVRRSLRTGQPETLQRRLITRLENISREFLVKVTPLREVKSREIYGSLVLFHDISELTRTQQIRAQFVENASHELRTPLTSIRGYLSTARDDADQKNYEQLPQFLSVISKSVDRLIELVNDMLTISGLESSWGLNLEPLRTDGATQEVVERLSPLAQEKKILITVQCLSQEVKADPKLLDQVLTNLVGNAIKYVPESGKIQITWTEDNDGKNALLSVKDSGPGIAPEHVGRLFERFYRVDKSRSRDIGGTGLGLAIVKHIMQSHGGSVSVKSELNQGSEFICRFPF